MINGKADSIYSLYCPLGSGDTPIFQFTEFGDRCCLDRQRTAQIAMGLPPVNKVGMMRA